MQKYYTEQKKLRKSQKTMQHKNTKVSDFQYVTYITKLKKANIA